MKNSPPSLDSGLGFLAHMPVHDAAACISPIVASHLSLNHGTPAPALQTPTYPLCSPATIAAISGGGWESLALVAASTTMQQASGMELQCIHYCSRVLRAFMVVQYMVIRVAVKSLSER